jgi:hypothetical protein
MITAERLQAWRSDREIKHCLTEISINTNWLIAASGRETDLTRSKTMASAPMPSTITST